MDMRGNRIDKDGNEVKNPLISEKQWQDFQNFINRKEIKVLFVCSEIPFLGKFLKKLIFFIFTIVFPYKNILFQENLPKK